MTPCTRCGGRCLQLDGEMACINCSRPCAPVVSTVPYAERGADDIVASIRRERAPLCPVHGDVRDTSAVR